MTPDLKTCLTVSTSLYLLWQTHKRKWKWRTRNRQTTRRFMWKTLCGKKRIQSSKHNQYIASRAKWRNKFLTDFGSNLIRIARGQSPSHPLANVSGGLATSSSQLAQALCYPTQTFIFLSQLIFQISCTAKLSTSRSSKTEVNYQFRDTSNTTTMKRVSR